MTVIRRRRKLPRLTSGDIAELATLYRAGAALDDLAIRLGCGVGHVRALLVGAGVTIRAPSSKGGNDPFRFVKGRCYG